MTVSKQPPAATISSEEDSWLKNVLNTTKEALQISMPVLILLAGYIVHTERFHERVKVFMAETHFTAEDYLREEAEHMDDARGEFADREVLQVELWAVRSTLSDLNVKVETNFAALNQRLSRMEARLDKDRADD